MNRRDAMEFAVGMFGDIGWARCYRDSRLYAVGYHDEWGYFRPIVVGYSYEHAMNKAQVQAEYMAIAEVDKSGDGGG